MPAGNAYPSGHLVASPFWGLAYAPTDETSFPILVVSFLDFSPWIPSVPSRFCFQSSHEQADLQVIKCFEHTLIYFLIIMKFERNVCTYLFSTLSNKENVYTAKPKLCDDQEAVNCTSETMTKRMYIYSTGVRQAKVDKNGVFSNITINSFNWFNY